MGSRLAMPPAVTEQLGLTEQLWGSLLLMFLTSGDLAAAQQVLCYLSTSGDPDTSLVPKVSAWKAMARSN